MHAFLKPFFDLLGKKESKPKPAPIRGNEIQIVRLGDRIVQITNCLGGTYCVPTQERECKVFYLERTDKHYLLLGTLDGAKNDTVSVRVRELDYFNTEVIEVTSSFLETIKPK